MDCFLDKARYSPLEQLMCSVTGFPEGTVRARAVLMKLQQVISTEYAAAADSFSVEIRMVLPGTDFTGYLLQVDALDDQEVCLATVYAGVDCSSSWTRFPRYGYVWDFTDGTDAGGKIAELNRFHINGLQFYDWQYRHHQPVAPDLSAWTDWSGRRISGTVLRDYIHSAHDHGMSCLAYNMIYAANMTYLHDGTGVDASWRLVKSTGEDFTCDMDASLGDAGILQYFNLLDPDWQRYIFTREREVFDNFDFDGWHGDTIGENGPMQTAGGKPLGFDKKGKPVYLVKNCYTRFLNSAKAAIGSKCLVFNPVGAQGIEQVNRSDADVLYTEFWPWDSDDDSLPYTSYFSIYKAIVNAWEQSGHKSLIVAAYVNYRNPSAVFNPPAVRLLDSVVFAAGGSRIELGNGSGMLSDEYFPSDRKKLMDEALRADVRRLYDFATAYENLLRDGQAPVIRKAAIDGQTVSADGRDNTIWCFAKADAVQEVFHFINLSGTDAGWRDVEQTKRVPNALPDLKTKLYTDFPVHSISIASPDDGDLRLRDLPFTPGTDGNGAYAAFVMPLLAYWNMILLR